MVDYVSVSVREIIKLLFFGNSTSMIWVNRPDCVKVDWFCWSMVEDRTGHDVVDNVDELGCCGFSVKVGKSLDERLSSPASKWLGLGWISTANGFLTKEAKNL